jgi:hypothetical protein
MAMHLPPKLSSETVALGTKSRKLTPKSVHTKSKQLEDII